MQSAHLPKLVRGLVRLAEGMNAIATVWTFSLVFFITADVAGRVFFNQPLTGAHELVKVSLVALVFLHIPHTLWVDRHIRSDILTSRMKENIRLILQVLTHILGALLFAGIVVSSWHHMITAWETGVYEGAGALRVPLAPVRTIVIIGSIVTGALFVIRAIENILKLFGFDQEVS